MQHVSFGYGNAAAFIGREIGVSDWREVSQAMIDAFAACTGDDQWIHVDVERARRESPYRAPVAHGFLSLALIPVLAYEIGLLPEGTHASVNYGLDKVRFLAPVKAGARVRLHARLAEFSPREGGRWLMKTINTLEIEDEPRSALIAEALALLTPAGAGA